MRRAFVLGNCQAETIADWMRAAAPDWIIEDASIAGVAPGDPVAVIAWHGSIGAADTIFSQLTDEQLAAYALPTSADMTAAGKTVVRLPVITFKGFQPDCTYVFTAGQAIGGAMGPYHSAIASAAFLEGLGIERALGLFNTFTYAALGYFAEFDTASTVLRETGEAFGLDLSGMVQPGQPVFMHTINHPAVSILGEVALQALERVGESVVDRVAAPRDPLGEAFRWPVYPELASRLGIAGDFSFGRSADLGEPVLDLRAVVEATYAGLAAFQDAHGPIVLDQGRPMATPVIERAQAFIRRHVVI